MGLDAGLLDLVGAVLSFENVVGSGPLFLGVPDFGIDMVDDVVLCVVDVDSVRFIVNDRRAVLHGRFGIEHGGEHFILDLDQLEGFVRDFGRFRRDDGHPIPHVAHFVVERDLIVRRGIGVALAAGCVNDARHILVCQHGLDAGQRLSFARVNTDNAGVGVWAGQHSCMQHATHLEVVGIDGFARRQLDGVDLRFRLADGAMLDQFLGGDDDSRGGLRLHAAAAAPITPDRFIGFVRRFERPCPTKQIGRGGNGTLQGPVGGYALTTHDGSRAQDRLHRLDVARFAVEHTRQCRADLRFSRVRVALK